MTGEASELYLDLRIAHPDLDPSYISQLLELVPQRSFRKGDLNSSFTKLAVCHEFGAWYFGTSHLISKDINFHLLWLLEKIEGKRSLIRMLRSNGYRVDISIFLSAESYHGVINLAPQAMKKLASFEIGLLYFDVYF